MGCGICSNRKERKVKNRTLDPERCGTLVELVLRFSAYIDLLLRFRAKSIRHPQKKEKSRSKDPHYNGKKEAEALHIRGVQVDRGEAGWRPNEGGKRKRAD